MTPRHLKGYSLLKFNGAEGPTYFVLESTAIPDEPEAVQESLQYFYEEHSCPTNWLRDCVLVAQDGDTDPHGFLEFVRFVEAEQIDDENIENEPAIAEMFPEILEKWPSKQS